MDEGLCRYKKLLRRRCAAVPSVSDKPSCSDKECANRAEAVLSVIPFVQNGRMVMTPKKQLHLPDSPLPPRGHRPPRSGRADAGDGRSAQRGRWQRGRAAAPRTYRRRRRRCCRWIGSSCPPHGKRRCPPSAHCVRHFPHKRGKLLCRYPKPSPLSRGRGTARAVEGAQNRGCDTKFVTSSTAPSLHRFSENHGSAIPQIFALASDASSFLCI